MDSFTNQLLPQADVESIWHTIQYQLSTGQLDHIVTAKDAKAIGAGGMKSLVDRFSAATNVQYHLTVRPNGDHRLHSTQQNAPKTKSPAVKRGNPPRPMNAFMLFRKHNHEHVKAVNPGIHNNDISKIIGQMWRDIDPATRSYWRQKAEEAKAEHLAAHPDYQYQPRKPMEKKRRMTKAKAAAAAAAALFEPDPAQMLPTAVSDLGPLGVDAMSVEYVPTGSEEMDNFVSTYNALPPVAQGPDEIATMSMRLHDTAAMEQAIALQSFDFSTLETYSNLRTSSISNAASTAVNSLNFHDLDAAILNTTSAALSSSSASLGMSTYTSADAADLSASSAAYAAAPSSSAFSEYFGASASGPLSPSIFDSSIFNGTAMDDVDDMGGFN